MSIKVMNRIWERSRNKGAALLLLLAIADHAHDDGGGAYPSVPALARKIRMSVRATQRLIQKLVSTGEVSVSIGGGPKGANIYRINLKMLEGGVRLTGGRGDKLTGVRGVKLTGEGVSNLQGRGDKSGAEGVTHVTPESSCKEGTVMEPSLQQQAGLRRIAAAAASDLQEEHKSVFSRFTVEDFVKATKRHATNPGGLARKLWRTGEEDSAIGEWMLAKEERNKREEQRAEPAPEIAADFSMDDWVDDLIANNWIPQLENERQQIEERGGPKLPCEHKVIAYFNNMEANNGKIED